MNVKVILGYIARSCPKKQIHKQDGSNRNKEYKWTSELCLRSWDYLTAAGRVVKTSVGHLTLRALETTPDKTTGRQLNVMYGTDYKFHKN